MNQFEMQARLKEFVNAGPKQWAGRAKKDPEFMASILAQTPDLPDDAPLPLRAYCATTGERPRCPNGNDRKLESILSGWRGCGTTSKCACAKQAVADAVKATKSQDTPEKKALTQARREATNLARYGHVNSGQAEAARDAHAAFYDDPDKVSEAVAKGAQTMLENHGVRNGFLTEKANRARVAPRSPESVARGAAKRVEIARNGGLLAKSYPKLVSRLRVIGFDLLTPFADYTGLNAHRHYDFRCHRCNDTFNDYLFASHDPTCPRCDPVRRCVQNPSKEELTLHAFIDTLELQPIYNSKRYIKPLELDILLLEQKIAIEYVGEYFHHDESSHVMRQDKRYHLDKLNRCKAIDLRLVTIFSDEWFKRRAACETRLRNLLGKPTFRVFARQTEVREITGDQARAFLETYHTQGHLKNTTCCLGLFHGQGLVSVMTFGATRQENNADDIGLDRHWELYRFASCGSVVGGASKLFKAFVRIHDPLRVTSFCDRRWGEGEVYARMGFVHARTNGPAEWWFRNGKRTHRWTLRKDRLVALGHDPAKTAHEILRELKYRCVWDCGTHKFVWDCPQS